MLTDYQDLKAATLGNVTPYDVHTERDLEVIQKRKEAKRRTLQARKGYNGAIGEQGIGL